MNRMHWLSAAAGALALGMFSVSAQAAPLGSATGGLNAASGENTLAQDIQWGGRRCWRHRGHWHCRRGYRRAYRYYYGDPYSYSYGPGFSFYFDRGHRRHHRHHRHRW